MRPFGVGAEEARFKGSATAGEAPLSHSSLPSPWNPGKTQLEIEQEMWSESLSGYALAITCLSALSGLFCNLHWLSKIMVGQLSAENAGQSGMPR